MQTQSTISVVIITRNRPQILKRCLDHLLKQEVSNYEIIVVDSSDNEETKKFLFNNYPNVLYVFLPNGKNKMPTSRNLGFKHAKSEVIAFIDDDCIVQKGWLNACARSYISDVIGGVGGMIIDSEAENESYKNNEIGKVAFNGERIRGFHKNPGRIIEVDHLGGGNMSFRKSIINRLNGFDIHYIGSNVLEETDFCARVIKAGYKLLFNPSMSVIHDAPHEKIIIRKNLNLKRQFYITRNSTYFMLVNFGFFRALVYMFTNNTYIMAFLKNPRLKSLFCIFICSAGKIVGFCVGLRVKLFTVNKK